MYFFLYAANQTIEFSFFIRCGQRHSDSAEDLEDSTTLKVHFKDLTCIKYRRDMYMTWDGLFGKRQMNSLIRQMHKNYFDSLLLHSSLVRWHLWTLSRRFGHQSGRVDLFLFATLVQHNHQSKCWRWTSDRFETG